MNKEEGNMSLRNAIGSIMISGNLMHEMRQLCDVIGKRPTGSQGERMAKDYLVERFRQFGLSDVHEEPFVAPYWKRMQMSARLVSPIRRPLSTLALPLNRTHKVQAEIVWAPFQTAEEFKKFAPLLKGKICLTPGESVTGLSGAVLHRSERIRLAYEAGAAAFLWISNWRGNVLPTGSMSSEISKTMPAFGITLEDGLLLQRLSEQGDGKVVVELDTRNELSTTTSWNVSGEIPGAKPDAPIVLLTAHYDSHDVTEGAFDNAAGCAIVLEAARVLAQNLPDDACRLRFVLFSAEETGLIGSQVYVQDHSAELRDMRFLLNLDGLGVAPSSKYIHVPIGAEVADYLRSVFTQFGYTVSVDNAVYMNWDHAAFARKGIPVGSLTAKWPIGTQLHFGHTPADSLDKIDPQDIRYAACCATLLAHYIATDRNWKIAHRTRAEVDEVLKAAGKDDEKEFSFVESSRADSQSGLGESRET